MNNLRKVAVIIGGSGSLGQATAKIFASKNYDLLITGRKLDKLEEVTREIQLEYPSVNIKNIYFDYNDDTSYDPFIKKFKDINENISILINTAAGFFKGNFIDMSTTQIESLIQANFSGFVKIFHGLMSHTSRNNNIDLINITSYSSATNLDTSKSSSLHIATKTALQVFDTTISNELLDSNIRLTTVAPGTFAKKGRVGLPLADIAELIWLIHSIPNSIKVDTVVASYTGK